ncbi:MAG: 50S ribosomal protein L9 [Verrucomicrobia bacterium]|jgi:large subunit ribosomal protein L9|nr:50S ribosomal protein L9 [Verrucomicrobiota bacterium]
MATEVFLMADVADLGVEGDVVTVADGYARNYLIPKQLGAPVTDATRRRLAKIQREREVAREANLAEARKLATKLSGVSVTIPMKTIEGEKLYGSVSEVEIADALKTQGFEIERSAVELEEHIKELGVFEVTIKLQPEVSATIKVWIVEE